jgi:NAD(P)-dependent dehydrogenase (short-subunit alcohol dehydrogenase family)
MNTMESTKNPVALVSGASRGIGLDVGRQLLAMGWRVAFGMRDPKASAHKVAAFKPAEGQSIIVQLDVTDEQSCKAAVAQTVKAFGHLDCLVNNAGIDYDSDQRAIAPDFARSRKVLETNLWGAWQLAAAAAPHVKAAQGTVVNVSSGAGQLDGMGGGTPAYSISKAALNALTVKLAAEMPGCRVNAVDPGWTATDMGGGGRPVAGGAQSVVWAAVLSASGPTAGFFRDGKKLKW